MNSSSLHRTAWRTGLAALLIGALATTHLSAQDNEANPNVGRWYQVEIILFQQRPEDNINEVWPTFPDLSRLPEALQLQRPGPTSSGLVDARTLTPLEEIPLPWPMVDMDDGTELPLVILPESLLTLSGQAERIADSRGRSVLLHTGWNMPVSAEADQDLIRIHTGARYGDHYEVDGTLGIHVGRFLHVEADIYQTQYELVDEPLPLLPAEGLPLPLDPDHIDRPPWQHSELAPSPTFRSGPTAVPVESAHFHETRRMRSNELHYLDHPQLGLIIQFTPYTPVEISPSTGEVELIEQEEDEEVEIP